MSSRDGAVLEAAPPNPKTQQPRQRIPRARILATAAAWSAVWWLIIGALIAPLVPGGWLAIAGAVLVSVAPLLVILERFNGTYASAATRVWVFRPFLYVQLGTPLVALTAAAGTMLGALVGRGVVLGRWTVAIAGASFALAAILGYVGSRQLRVKALDARYPDLPPALDGLRIVQLTDLHLGPHTPARHIRNIVRAVEAAQPDAIVFTGDQVDDDARDVEAFGRAFGALRAPLGVYAVAGNHDVYAGWPQVRAGLEALGITVLVNRAVARSRGGTSFWIAGTGDPAAGGRMGRETGAGPDIERTLEAIPRGAFTIALAHNPALFPALARRGVALTLSGHTHYGQVSVPWLGWSVASMFLQYAMGAHRLGGSLLYISPGTNYWGIPVRLGALHEVTVVTLRRARGDQREPAIEVSEPVARSA